MHELGCEWQNDCDVRTAPRCTSVEQHCNGGIDVVPCGVKKLDSRGAGGT